MDASASRCHARFARALTLPVLVLLLGACERRDASSRTESADRRVMVEDSLADSLHPDSPVRWDPTAKVYWVAVRIEDGSIRQMRVEPANRAVATLRLEQVDRGDAVDYQYRVGADSSSPETVSQIAVPCPPDGGITARTGGDWQSMSEWRGTLHCEYTVYAARGQGQVDVALRSTLLAGVGEAIVVGAGGAPLWPTEDPTEETIALGPLVDSLSGAPPNGLVGRMPAPVPKYERRVVAQTDSGLQILAHELRRICEGTRWIADPATCRQLEQRLPLRLAALREGGAPSAPSDEARAEIRRQLDEFMRVLEASRDVTVDQNAFTILKVIAGVVRAPLVSTHP
jgi:hypothetical protein